jgi:hypothetical protein
MHLMRWAARGSFASSPFPSSPLKQVHAFDAVGGPWIFCQLTLVFGNHGQ